MVCYSSIASPLHDLLKMQNLLRLNGEDTVSKPIPSSTVQLRPNGIASRINQNGTKRLKKTETEA
jgi:hypothetical protein